MSGDEMNFMLKLIFFIFLDFSTGSTSSATNFLDTELDYEIISNILEPDEFEVFGDDFQVEEAKSGNKFIVDELVVPVNEPDTKDCDCKKRHRLLSESDDEISNSKMKKWSNETESSFENPRKILSARIKEEEKRLRKDLVQQFNSQHYGKKFSLRNYDIPNWPKDVDMYKISWTGLEISKIRETLDELVFIQRDVKFSLEKQLNIDKLGDLKGILIQHWSEKYTSNRLLSRFKEETNTPNANRIDYSNLDRSAVPRKYDEFPINGRTMKLEKFYKNPEIVDNIHFSIIKRGRGRRKVQLHVTIV